MAGSVWTGQQLTDVLAWYLKTSKLALALAIIGRTPPEKNSREHAEELAKSLCQKGIEWKLKAEAWKAEVLQLRQELFLTRMQSAARSNDGIGDDSSNRLGFPTQNPVRSMNDSSHLDDSGCDVSNGQGSDTQDLLTNCSLKSIDYSSLTSEQTLPVVTSISLSATSNTPRNDESEVNKKMLTFHTQFLQSLIRIRKIATNRTPTAETLALGNDYSVVTDSVSHFAESLLVFFAKPKSLPPASLLMETTESLVCLMQDGKLPMPVLTECTKRVEELVKKLVKVIMDNTEVNRFQEQELAAKLLIVLGQCPSLRAQVFANLLSGMNHFIDYLWQTNQAELDVSSFENIFYLFWILEQILQQRKPAGSGAAAENVMELERLQQRLDQTVLHLSSDFPLFTMYLWRLAGLFTVTSQQNDN
ncbi:meiosis-specific protein MEI4 isoform X1 [Leucoraja erinacea]|uniref:meiosis-specific protein MEI4 isoform X1 n=1 Tax=Leucoraja erinaceus TaxID=7782 RepID=UPI002457EDF2|nr:meiosis-specific protein MEI4 isoform X1 [Leucoraja erinacea]